jgi:hypothetical protein
MGALTVPPILLIVADDVRDGVATMFEMFGKLAVELSSSPVIARNRSRSSISRPYAHLLGDDPINAGPEAPSRSSDGHEVSSRSCC